MTLATRLRTLKTRLGHHQPRRPGRRTGSHNPARAWLRMEQLEDRLALSGFGPEDGSYIVEPRAGKYNDVQIQPGDQKIVAAGNVDLTLGLTIARYDSAGNADASFGTGGLSTPSGGGNAGFAGLALQPNGKAIVSTQNGIGWFGAARINTNGSLDSSFGSGGWAGVNVSGGGIPVGVGLQSTGKIVVGGLTIGSSIWFRSATVARFTANGATDSGRGGFGQIGVGNKALGYTKTNFGGQLAEFNAIAIQSDDKIVAVGLFSPTGSPAGQLVVARYAAGGILDTTFNGSGYSMLALPGISFTNTTSGNGVALQSNGKIVVVSTSAGIDGPTDLLVARYNTTGTLDTSFGGGSGYVRLDIDGNSSPTTESGNDIAIQADGKIVVVGQEVASTGTDLPRNVLVARLNPDGTPDLTFGSGGFKIAAAPPPTPTDTGVDYHSFFPRGVALQSNGNIIVSGWDNRGSDFYTSPQPLLIRFFGATASPLQAGSVALASAALASAAIDDTGMGTLSSTVVPPQRPAPDAAFVEDSLSAEILVVGKPGVPVAATVSPRRDSPAVSSAVERIFADDDLLRGLLAEDPLGTIVG